MDTEELRKFFGLHTKKKIENDEEEAAADRAQDMV